MEQTAVAERAFRNFRKRRRGNFTPYCETKAKHWRLTHTPPKETKNVMTTGRIFIPKKPEAAIHPEVISIRPLSMTIKN